MTTRTINWNTGGGIFTVTYGGSDNGTIVVTSDANTLHEGRSQSLTVKTTKGGTVTKTITVAQAMKPYIDLTNAVVSAANQTYSGSALTPVPTVTLNGETIPSTGYDVTYSNNTNAGTATIIITGNGDYTGTANGSFTINKAAPTYTAPTAKSLTYNRGSQALLNAGSTSHGTIQYSSNGSSWSTTIPSQTNADTYTVYWRLAGDSNHTDVSSTSISATIAKTTPVVATSPSASTGLTYTGSNQNLLSGGSMKHSSSDTTAVAGTFTYAQGKNAGTYNSLTWSFAPTDSTNYNSTSGTVSGSVSIAKANPVYTAPTANNRTYNTSSAALLNAGLSTTAGSFTYCTTQSGTYTTTIPTQTNAGTYTTYWKFTPTDTTNYNSIGATAVSTTISAKTVSSPTITLSQSSYTYSGSACTPTATVKDGSTTISSSEYTVSYSNNTNAGTATVTITDKSGGNYTVSGSTTFTINKATGQVTTAPTANTLTYSGSAQYLVTAGSGTGTMYYRYKLSTASSYSSWSTTRPSATTAGTYNVQYYCAASSDGNYSASSTSSLNATMAKASRTLSFSSPTTNVAVGSTVANTATPSAGSGDGTITYSSSSTSVATVNSSTGVVTGVANGSSVITATISEGTNYLSASTTYTISVIAAVIDFNYTGSVQSATLGAGTYKLETWGAQGGSNAANSTYGITAKAGGKGGYSVGQITLTSPTTVYVFVGGQGSSSGNGGWNGGGGGSGSSTYSSTDSTTTAVTKTPIWRRAGTISDANIAVTISDGGFTATKSAAQPGKNIIIDLTMCSFPVRVTLDYSLNGSFGNNAGLFNSANANLSGTKDNIYNMSGFTSRTGSIDVTLTDSTKPFVGFTLNDNSVGGSFTVSNTSISYSKTVEVTNAGASNMGCGGGSTDIALTSSSMSYSSYRTNRTSASYLSRMIVAGGGAGGAMVGSNISGFLTGLDPSTNISGGYNTGACRALYGLGLNDWKGYAGKKITAVKLNVYRATTRIIQIGVVRNWRTTVQLDSSVSYNPSDVEVQNLTVSGTGVQTITLPIPIILGANDWIGIGNYNYSSNGAIAQLRFKDIGYGSRCTLYGPYDPDTPNKLTEQSAASAGYSPVCAEFLYEETTNDSQVGYVGGGTSGGGYSSSYKGRQSAAGTNGAFGYGANQTATNYRYAPACGGGGWYGGGSGSASDSSMTNCKYSGGGSGFVNTSANSSYRPSGYTGLQLDSGATYDGSQSFKSPSGTNETGHSGNGYARITRL